MNHKILPIFGFFLFFLSACVQEAGIEERLACVDLTSHSALDIPECDSQEECLKKFGENFSLDYSELSPTSKAALGEFKNRVALSWLYFNKALEKVREINKACSGGNNLGGIDRLVNEFNHSASKGFEEIEKAHQIAFAVILVEKADLELERIDLIKEEPLFEDYVLLNDNLNAINSQSTTGASFAAQYFSSAQKFSALAAKTGFSENIIKETTIFDAVDYFDDKILSKLKTNFVFAFISDAYTKSFSFLKNFFETERSVNVLQSVPSFEFFDSFNWFAGTKNSTVKKFSSLVITENFHKKNVKEKITILEEQVQGELSAVEEKIMLIDDATYSQFDQGFLAQLALLTGFSSTIGSSDSVLKDLSTIKSDSSKELAFLKTGFFDLKTKSIMGGVALGEKTGALKEFLAKTTRLGESIEYHSQNVTEGLKSTCTEKVGFISKKLSADFSPFGDEALSAAAETKFAVQQFREAGTAVQSLVLCKKTVENYNRLELAIKDKGAANALALKEAGECMKELEDFFEANSDFSDLETVFGRLKESIDSHGPISLAQECSAIKEKTLSELNYLPGALDVASNYAAIKKMLSTMEKISFAGSDKLSQSAFEEISGKLSRLESFFEGGVLSLRAASLLQELSNTSSSILFEAREELRNAFKRHLEKNSSVEIYSDSKVRANSFNLQKTKITAQNLIEPVDIGVSFSVNAQLFQLPQTEYATPNISGYHAEKALLTVDLNFVPLGSSVLVLESSGVFAKTTEETKPISVSVENAFFEKQVTIDANGSFPELIVPASLPVQADLARTKVFFREQEVSFTQANNGIEFSLLNVFPKDTATVFFAINKPLELIFSGMQSEYLDQNTVKYIFFVKLKNNTPFGLEEVKALAPLPVDESSFVLGSAYTIGGDKITAEKSANKGVFLSVKDFEPSEEKTVLLEVRAKNYSIFWQEFVDGLLEKIALLESSENSSIRPKASLLRQSLLAANESADFKNEATIEEILELSVQVQLLLAEEDSLQKNQFAESSLREEILSQIKGLEESALFLESLGFQKDSEKLRFAANKAKAQLNSQLIGFEGLMQVKSTLNAVEAPQAKDVLSREINRLKQGAAVFLSLEKDFEIVFPQKENFFEAEKETMFYIGLGDFNKAFSVFTDMNSAFYSMEKQAMEKSRQIIGEKKYFFELYSQTLEGIPLKAEKLRGFEEAFRAELVNHFFPTTSERIDRLLLQLDSLETKDYSGLLEGLDGPDSNFAFPLVLNAVKSAKGAEKDFESVKKIDDELSKDLDWVREQAYTVYGLAQLKAKNIFGVEAKELLEQASQKLSAKEYVEAIVLSEKILLLSEQKSKFEIPVVVVPLALLVLAGLYFKGRKKPPVEPPKKTKLERVKPS
ncbi:MAG: hypothetical protein Q7K34_03985 [archaeon]|nr:hypothetical protein [archaeon]